MKLIAALPFAFVLAACAADTAPDPAPDPGPLPARIDDGLTLTASLADRLSGEYVDAKRGHTLRFDSARAGDHFELHLATGAGVPLIDADTAGDTYRFSYLGGRLTMTVERAWIEAVRAEGEDGPAAQDETALRWDGDLAVLDEMLAIPEVAQLPWMSRALGARGFTGAAYPASLALHKLARQSADALAIELPPLPPAAGDTLFCSRPTANECYGMCGNGCSCWSWVCGDCCYHTGCARHDTWCRQGQWYYCYNITAVIALFGC